MIDKIIYVDKSSTGKIYIPINCSLVMNDSAYNNSISNTIDADLEAADFSPDNRVKAKETAKPTIHRLTGSEVNVLQAGNTPSQINPVNIVNTGTYFGIDPSVFKITFGEGKHDELGLYAAESMIYKYDTTDASNPLFTLWIDASDLEFSRYLQIYRETETTTKNKYEFTPEVYYHEEEGEPVFMTLESDVSYKPVLYTEPGDYTPIFLQQIN